MRTKKKGSPEGGEGVGLPFYFTGDPFGEGAIPWTQRRWPFLEAIAESCELTS